MKVVMLSVLRTGHLYPPVNIPGTHFCQRQSQPHDERIMSTENSNDTIRNRTRSLLACRAVPQPTVPPCNPRDYVSSTFIHLYILTNHLVTFSSHFLLRRWVTPKAHSSIHLACRCILHGCLPSSLFPYSYLTKLTYQVLWSTSQPHKGHSAEELLWQYLVKIQWKLWTIWINALWDNCCQNTCL
jgi:hypothetical protein